MGFLGVPIVIRTILEVQQEKHFEAKHDLCLAVPKF